MILVDANVLLYAYHSASEFHKEAREWLESSLSRPEPLRFSWLTLTAFLRISTNYRAFERPLVIAEATSLVSEWLAQPSVSILDPGDRYWGILCSLLNESQANGPLVMDACLAALAMEHGAILCTTDRDFARFPDVKTLNPCLH